jgi:hypothetical protein
LFGLWYRPKQREFWSAASVASSGIGFAQYISLVANQVFRVWTGMRAGSVEMWYWSFVQVLYWGGVGDVILDRCGWC